MIDFAFSWTNKKIILSVIIKYLLPFVAFLFFVMQYLYIVEAYGTVATLSRYEAKQAKAIVNYLVAPSLPAGNCPVPTLVICNMPIDKRNELMDFLQKENLNVINPKFQWKYRIFPFDNITTSETSAVMSSDSTVLKIFKWGPGKVDTTSNPVYIWISPSRRLETRSDYTIRINNQKIIPIVGKDVITFTVPPAITATAGKYSIVLVDETKSIKITVGIFEVTSH